MLAVVATVRFVLDRTDWTLGMILAALGVSRPTYHRWVGRPDTPPPLKRLQLYEILPEERQDIIDYARHHPNVRHQELAYKMLDAGVSEVSPLSVYRKNLWLVDARTSTKVAGKVVGPSPDAGVPTPR